MAGFPKVGAPLSIVMVFPGMINELPPLFTCALTLSELGQRVVVVAAGFKGAIGEELRARGVTIETIGLKCYPKGLIGKLKLRVQYADLLCGVVRNVKPDVIWYHGAYGMAFRPLAEALPAVRRAVCVSHAHELHDGDRVREWVQMRAIRSSDAVICPEDNRAWILKCASKATAKTFVIPNRPLEAVAIGAGGGKDDLLSQFRKHGGSSKCSRFLLYQGLVATERCVVELITAFRSLKRDDIGLIVMGPVSDERYGRQLEELCRRDPRVVMFRALPAPQHLQVTNQCDWGVVLYAPTSLNNVYCAPNKIYEYTAAGIGMVLPRFPGIEHLVAEFGIGVLCDPCDVASISGAVAELVQRDMGKTRSECKRFLEEQAKPIDCYRTVLAFLVERVGEGKTTFGI